MMANPEVQGRLVEDVHEDSAPGSFEFLRGVKRGANPANLPVNTLPDDAYTLAGLKFVCPGGCGGMGFCYLENPELDRDGPAWSWDGDREAPTLSPSILSRVPHGCGWHGYLQRGVWRPCSDSACPGAPPTKH